MAVAERMLEGSGAMWALARQNTQEVMTGPRQIAYYLQDRELQELIKGASETLRSYRFGHSSSPEQSGFQTTWIGSHSGSKEWEYEFKREVANLWYSAGSENWDGEGALALTRETIELALKVADTFPAHVGKPDVRATPHGEVSFEWEVGPKVMFSIGVVPPRNVAFFGYFHNSRLRGNEEWNGTLPKLAMCGFEQLREAQMHE